MIPWWSMPSLLTMLALMTVFWIATSRQDYCSLLAAVFVILLTPALVFIWTILYLLSYLL